MVWGERRKKRDIKRDEGRVIERNIDGGERERDNEGGRQAKGERKNMRRMEIERWSERIFHYFCDKDVPCFVSFPAKVIEMTDTSHFEFL